MCDTARCAACRPRKERSVFWPVVFGLVEASAVGLWWLARKVLAPVMIAVGWCTYVFLSGRTWRHQVRRRYVRREVRAAGNWALTAAAALLVWQPLATGIVLAAVGGSLVTTALVWRHHDRLRELVGGRFPQLRGRGPIRVKATVGEIRRITDSREGR